ncbi:hypothetical protein TWF481_003365 [Arthrobotrys musiformis]|uniref:RNase H type-1 domain-containing protein n=1 Tax=Arthrobotrys musiformis TaxID=47236 RepID=A0AAV9VS12_9PEZI
MPPPTTENRLFTGCPVISKQPFPEQIIICDCCTGFTVKCCQHQTAACHHHKVFFTDGFCDRIDGPGSKFTAGIGIAAGTDARLQISKPFSDLPRDVNGSLRSTHLAELKAAIEAVAAVDLFHEQYARGEGGKLRPHAQKRVKTGDEDGEKEYESLCIIAMCSEYVVGGMVKRLPAWRENGMKTAQGHAPANLDLFLTLEEDIERVERRGWGVRICFWLIPRKFNEIAVGLGREASKRDTLDDW